MNELEREDGFLLERLRDDEISEQEYNRPLKEIRYQYSREVRSAVEEAYDRELERWDTTTDSLRSVGEQLKEIGVLKKVKDAPCISPLHEPPMHIVLKPGEYEYTCPSCGEVTKFTVDGFF